MTDGDLRALLAAEYQDALAATNASKLSTERADAMSYSLGDMSKDMPQPIGRSGAVSMDVSDTIEGMLPQLMEIFTGSDDVVRFEPVGPEDVPAAQQETDYINHVLMNQNPGFLVLYSFIKDALLSKVGVVKVWWEKKEEEKKETYYNKSDDEYALIAMSQDVEIIEHTAHPYEGQEADLDPDEAMGPMLHDITVRTKKDYSCAKVMGVPPEEFGIERGARSIRDCNYCFHKVVTSTGSLLAKGYDPTQVEKLTTYRAFSNEEETKRDTVEEGASAGNSEMNKAARQVEIIEHYVRMDYEDDGKPCLYRVVTGADADGSGMVLKRDKKPDIEEIDAIPFAAITPIIVTHRFFGRSIADLVMDIQRIKTALLRGLLDNIYMVNTPRTEVAESHASDKTLDDLLVSRPNGIVRTKQPGGLIPLVTPPVANAVYPALEYMDTVRAWRTGVSEQSAGIDPNVLQGQTATAAALQNSMSQGKLRLIARIFAETGIKDLMWLLHGTIKKYADKEAVVRLRNQWVPVDPRNWKTRDDLTINVGLGTGSKNEQIVHLLKIAEIQKELIMGGKAHMVTDEKLYNTTKRLTRLLNEPDTETFFVDPTKPDPKTGQLPQPQPQIDPKVVEIQGKLAIEKIQAQADIATEQKKTESQIQIAATKAALDEQMARNEDARKEREHQMRMVEIIAKHATQPKKTDANGNVVDSGPDPSILHGLISNLSQPKSRGMKIVYHQDGPLRGRVSHSEPM